MTVTEWHDTERVALNQIEYDAEQELKAQSLSNECGNEIEESVNDLISDIIDKYDQMGMNASVFVKDDLQWIIDRIAEEWEA